MAHTEAKAKEDIEHLKNNNDNLKKEFMHAEVEWKNQLNEERHRKEKDIEKI